MNDPTAGDLAHFADQYEQALDLIEADQRLSDDEIRAIAAQCGEDEQTVRDMDDAMQCCAEERDL